VFHHSQCGSQSSKVSAVEEVAELKKVLQKESLLRKAAEEEVNSLKSQLAQCKRSEVCFVALEAFLVLTLSILHPPPPPFPIFGIFDLHRLTLLIC
jgi:hypothetical protein